MTNKELAEKLYEAGDSISAIQRILDLEFGEDQWDKPNEAEAMAIVWRVAVLRIDTGSVSRKQFGNIVNDARAIVEREKDGE